MSFTLLATLGAIAGWSQVYSQQDQKPMRDPSGIPPPNPAANPQPNANQRMLYRMQQQEDLKRIEKLNVLRQKLMTDETDRLLALAREVHQKTAADPKSITAIEMIKIQAIEKLARSVREKMQFVP
ncbi:MAG TPA: hypothetical protein VL346_03435 [Acidobacteriaceae bacterium]|nr:hypothetical protein [Acidobacteriaceae bacterium]